MFLIEFTLILLFACHLVPDDIIKWSNLCFSVIIQFFFVKGRRWQKRPQTKIPTISFWPKKSSGQKKKKSWMGGNRNRTGRQLPIDKWKQFSWVLLPHSEASNYISFLNRRPSKHGCTKRRVDKTTVSKKLLLKCNKAQTYLNPVS